MFPSSFSALHGIIYTCKSDICLLLDMRRALSMPHKLPHLFGTKSCESGIFIPSGKIKTSAQSSEVNQTFPIVGK